MIQRIQTVYLLLVALFSAVMISGTVIKFAGDDGSLVLVRFSGISSLAEGSMSGTMSPVALSVAAISAAVAALACVFLYKRRKVQMRAAKLLIVLMTAVIAFYTYYVITIPDRSGTHWVPTLKSALPVLAFILAILAHLAISKDERLVRSYDRLR